MTFPLPLVPSSLAVLPEIYLPRTEARLECTMGGLANSGG